MFWKVWRGLSERMVYPLEAVGGFFVGLIALMMGIEVISRYGFQATHAFMEEINRYFNVWAVFMVAGVLLKAGRHISVPVLPQLLKGKKRAWLRVIISLSVIVGSGSMLIAGWQGTMFMWRTGASFITEFAIPGWLIMFALPLGMIFVIFWAVETLIGAVFDLLGRQPPVTYQGGEE